MPTRFFTPAEANEALASVRPLVERLVEHRADLLVAQARFADLAAGVAGNGGGIAPEQAADLTRAAAAAERGIRDAVADLEKLGVVVKDLDTGLVDFPSERDGEPVFLCWQLGEDTVAYWHGLEEGFVGRKPI